jgi:hypothetical protein
MALRLIVFPKEWHINLSAVRLDRPVASTGPARQVEPHELLSHLSSIIFNWAAARKGVDFVQHIQ